MRGKTELVSGRGGRGRIVHLGLDCFCGHRLVVEAVFATPGKCTLKAGRCIRCVPLAGAQVSGSQLTQKQQHRDLI